MKTERYLSTGISKYSYVLIKGAGDLASGVACVLVKAGFRVVMIEIAQPTCVRRRVSFAEAVYSGQVSVAGIIGRRVRNFAEAMVITAKREVAVLIDPEGETLVNYPPTVYVDAAMTKKNMGTSLQDAEVVIALGPGFTAGVDAHAVIETQRGPDLGKPIYNGTAAPNTGIPGSVLGYTQERVLRSPGNGIFVGTADLGDIVAAGDIVGFVGEIPVKAKISGTVRGLLKSGLAVAKGMKLGDIHPADDPGIISLVTDKAWTVGRGVLQAIAVVQIINKVV